MAQTPSPYVPPVSAGDMGQLWMDIIYKKNHDALHEKINARFSYVFEKMMAITGRRFDWYDFDNEAGEDRPGFFDPQQYLHDIGIVISGDTGSGGPYSHSIPTAWLMEDFEDTLTAQVEQDNIKKADAERVAKQQREDKAKDAQRLRASIASKLTAEELKFIGFK